MYISTDCAELIVANGMANPSSEVPHGTEVTVVCDSGYTLFGNNAVICNRGYFAGLPSCLKGNLIHKFIFYGFLFFPWRLHFPPLVGNISYLPYLDITSIF